MTNHQKQQDQEPMDSHKNPNLETTHNHHHHVLPPPSSSSQDYNKTLHQHNTHLSKKTFQEDEGFIFKNSCEVIKKPTFLSSSCSYSPASGERYTMPPPPQDIKKTNPQHNTHVSNKINGNEGFTIKNTNCEVIKEHNSLSCSSPLPLTPPEVEESGRDRLTRHRAEMAGRVRIPDIWGHEDLLKDWIDCTVFDSSLGNNTIMSARAALVQERRSTLRIQNQC